MIGSRIFTTGSRQWTDRITIEHAIIVTTMAFDGDPPRLTMQFANGQSAGGGADALVEEVCRQFEIPFVPYPVDPELDGRHRGAPLKRNERAIKDFKPDLVLAFRSDGKSNGTDKTIAFASKLDIPVLIFRENLK